MNKDVVELQFILYSDGKNHVLIPNFILMSFLFQNIFIQTMFFSILTECISSKSERTRSSSSFRRAANTTLHPAI